MTCYCWELVSWIATTIGTALTVVGIGIIIYQLCLQKKQSRLAALDVFFSELDTYETRLAREHIYKAVPDILRLKNLDEAANIELRKDVDNTLATFEKMAYKIITNQVPSKDAFNLWGGVLLSMANKVWPYIEDERMRREKEPLSHKLIYRRYLEDIVLKWIPRYCKETAIKSPSRCLATKEKLQHIFESRLCMSGISR